MVPNSNVDVIEKLNSENGEHVIVSYFNELKEFPYRNKELY
jgi:hypothetical protein